ncbi:MAG: hypothetical protein HW408_765, partial [Actinobacteria bacterium]|nr:hypothetical protein [Actinomycetota bacterium]
MVKTGNVGGWIREYGPTLAILAVLVIAWETACDLARIPV